MPSHNPDFTAALEAYLRHLAADRHAAVPETSRYGYLQTLLNAAGEQLAAPRVHAIVHPANSGAGIPDLGLYAAQQPDDARPHFYEPFFASLRPAIGTRPFVLSLPALLRCVILCL